MGYRHIPVRYFTKDRTELDTRIEAAKGAGWQWWLDAIPVSHELYELAMGVRKAYPFIKFYATTEESKCHWHWNSGNNALVMQYASEIFVAIDTCPYVLAKIGHGRYSATNHEGTSAYMVRARGIENERYHSGREQYHMRITASLKVAIKNTLANLLPYDMREVADHEYEEYRSKSQHVGASKSAKLPALLGSVTHSVLLNEIRALTAMGVTFNTPEFRSVAQSCDDAAKLANEERNKRIDVVLMHFVERPLGIVAECVGMQNIRAYHSFKPESLETYPLADVPQALQDKVAVLQTLLPGDHVDGVGMKVEEMLYWVEK
jgi:hypothetical protein